MLPSKNRYEYGVENLKSKIYTHPVIFDYLLNCHGDAFIKKFFNQGISFTLIRNFVEGKEEIMERKRKILEILIDFFLNLDRFTKLERDLGYEISKFRIDIAFISYIFKHGNIKAGKFAVYLLKTGPGSKYFCADILETKDGIVDEMARIEIAEYLYSQYNLYVQEFNFKIY